MNEVIDSTDRLRRKVLIGMCINLGLAALILGIANLFLFAKKSPILGILELGYFVLSAWMLMDISKRPMRVWFLPCHTTILGSLVILGSASHNLEGVLFLWSIALPTVFYLALGKRLGFAASAVFIVLEMWVVIPNLTDTLLIPAKVFANLSLAYLCVWVVSHTYESSREKSVNELRYMALHDPLTQALNRRALVHSLEQKIVNIEYLLMLDIDDFKQINDSYGHESGDEVLVSVVERLQSICGEDYVYRTGGEEFIVALSSVLMKGQCVNCVTNRIQLELSGIVVQTQVAPIAITLSGGLVKNDEMCSYNQVLANADKSLYLAKNSGKNQVFYNQEPLDTRHCAEQ
ncbi:GGDEF domain-containing protein [Vibrio intestinalis]|uniref:GGDEF domain-containing protein n=1 Tax=Vibrio intestinalis TaxID=2933291 RepID=UPI0021A5340D|nr:sensor domain-containing diguanylate cyclase [Vibrio intestinalis]